MSINPTKLSTMLNGWKLNKYDEYASSRAWSFRVKKDRYDVLIAPVPQCCGAVSVFSPKVLPESVQRILRRDLMKSGLLVLFVMPNNTTKAVIGKQVGTLQVFSGTMVRGYGSVYHNVIGRSTKKYDITRASITRSKKTFSVGGVTITKWAEKLYFMNNLYTYNLDSRVLKKILNLLKPTDHLFGIINKTQRNDEHVFKEISIPCYACNSSVHSNSRLYLYHLCGTRKRKPRTLDTNRKPVKLKSPRTAVKARKS